MTANNDSKDDVDDKSTDKLAKKLYTTLSNIMDDHLFFHIIEVVQRMCVLLSELLNLPATPSPYAAHR
jgi:hypothetical protein